MISLTCGFNVWTCRRCARVYIIPESSDVTGCPLCARDESQRQRDESHRARERAEVDAASLRRQVASLKGQITRLRGDAGKGDNK